MGLRVVNHSGYDTSDLQRFARAGLRANGVRGAVLVTFTSSPIRTRGCSFVGGPKRITIALAAPSYHGYDEDLLVAKAAWILNHEAMHARDAEHEEMCPGRTTCPLLESQGRMPRWARGLRLRHVRRAPDQMKALRPFARSLQRSSSRSRRRAKGQRRKATTR